MNNTVEIEELSLTIFDDSLDIKEMARLIVGQNNGYKISLEIPFETIENLTVNLGPVSPKLVGCLPWETGEKASQRLVGAGYFLGNATHLVQLIFCFFGRFAKYSDIFVLSKESRWRNSDGDVCVLHFSAGTDGWQFEYFRLDKPLLGDRVAVLVF